MSDKSLGQVAFEAAKQCPVLMWDTLAPWEEQRPDVREAWEAAAQAVADEAHSGLREIAKSLEDDMDRVINANQDDLEEAVSIACKLYDAIMDPEEAKP